MPFTLGKMNVLFTNGFLGLLLALSVEWLFSTQEHVKDNTGAPNVNSGIIWFAVNNLRGHITQTPYFFIRKFMMINLLRQSKISELDFSLTFV